MLILVTNIWNISEGVFSRIPWEVKTIFQSSVLKYRIENVNSVSFNGQLITFRLSIKWIFSALALNKCVKHLWHQELVLIKLKLNMNLLCKILHLYIHYRRIYKHLKRNSSIRGRVVYKWAFQNFNYLMIHRLIFQSLNETIWSYIIYKGPNWIVSARCWFLYWRKWQVLANR